MDIFSSWHASGGEWRSFMFTIGVSSASMYLLLGFAVGWHMIPYADTPNHSQGPRSVPWNLKWTSLGHLHLIWSNLCILLNMEQLFDEYIYIYICIKLLSILGITPVVDNKGSRTVSSKAVSFVASSFNFKKKNTKTQQPGKPTWFPSLSLWVGEGENVDHFPIHVCRKCPPSARVPRCCWDLPMQQARIGWWKLWFQDGPKPRIRSTSSDG